ncbi:sensor histidine kinase [Taibaiella soli]|uniref:Signal transduction histidine kinase internal region domain-containing protein n=1 Tax=Taibaiella soli TaxID=1649169 RepID=A0A2W2BE24_9BACT|nr:histidine kinase [Taibaiella soli]PZF74137.1 hypothetical protein DN068_03745 [Taibaiella soli]
MKPNITATHFYRRLVGLLLFLLCSFIVRSQDYNQFNVNIHHGLPSNTVYDFTIDKLNYMWFCTDRGLVRYNGYDCKVYTLTDGLPGNDIWGLQQDGKGRLWVLTISNKLGYILNSHYHEVYTKNIHTALYPNNFMVSNSDIKFFYLAQKNFTTNSLYVEKNDTLFETDIRMRRPIFVDSNTIIDADGQYLKRYKLTNDYKLLFQDSLPNLFYKDTFVTKASFVIGNYLYRYKMYGEDLDAEDLRTGELISLHYLFNEKIFLICQIKKNVYANIGNHVYRIDSLAHLSAADNINNFMKNGDIPVNLISYMTEDHFWGTCLGTRTNGFYFGYETPHLLRKYHQIALADYEYIGNGHDGGSYWWNYTRQTIQRLDTAGNTTFAKYDAIAALVSIIPYDSSRSLLLDKGTLYWFYNMQRAPELIRYKEIYSELQHKKLEIPLPYTRAIYYLDSSHFYMSGAGVYDARLNNQDSASLRLINEDRFYNLEYDSVRQAIWFYNNYKVYLHYIDRTKKNPSIGENLFRSLGFTNVEKIISDGQTGNIFLKDNNHLYYINLRNGTITALFNNYNLENSFPVLHNRTLIIGGKFGVLFSKITGPGKFEAPVLYPNFKSSLYQNIEGFCIASGKVILKTDNGTYMQPIPSDTELLYSAHRTPHYKMIVSYHDTLYDLQHHNKISILPGVNKIGFDIINPRGNGAVSYRYIINGSDSSWQDLNGTDLVLPELEAEKTYTLSIQAQDAVWRSDPITLTLYIVPLWWQSLRWRIIFWIFGTTATLTLLVVTILLTRYQTIKAGRKKQHLLLLELRSIYAQINPHFIFNTLNTALYFIKKNKMQEASAHVSKFSTLLRSYLESSRHRYISLREEITNIRTYIELQQTRFEPAFTYEIIVNDEATLNGLFIPTLLLQPIIENAINHGLVPKGHDGHLIISFYYETSEQAIVCMIEDNGIGREKSRQLYREEQTNKESYGSKMIEELIDIFNRYEPIKLSIEYYDKQPPETGTRVTIKIKNPYDEQQLQLRHYR